MPYGGIRSSSSAGAISDEVALGMLSELAPAIVGRVDTAEILVELGGRLLDRWGYHPGDLVGRPLVEVSADATVLRVVRSALAGETVQDTTVLDGRTWLLAARPVCEGGHLTGAVCVLTFADEGDVHRELAAQESVSDRLAALVELSGELIAMAELDGRVTYINRSGRELAGLAADANVVGLSTADFFDERDADRVQQNLERLRADGAWEGRARLRHAETGESIPVSVRSFLITRTADDEPLALATVLHDLRERERAEQAMAVRIQEQRAISGLGHQALVLPLAELMDEAVKLLAARYPTLVAGVLQPAASGESARLIACSDPALTGVSIEVSEETPFGRALSRNQAIATDDVTTDPRFPAPVPTSRFGARSILGCPIPGEERPWGMVGTLSGEPRSWTEDDLAFIESVAATLGAAVRRDELEGRLQHQALHDPLTGLPNRALVLDRIESALGRSARHNSLLAVLLLDVDDFKSVNDTLGHSRGDELLAELALRLGRVVRDGDTVARLGGDEFVVVCEDVTSEDDLAFVAEALLEACATGVDLGGRRVNMSVSVGVSLCVAGNGSTAALVSESDMAMYRAKRDRPGTYRIFDEAMRGDVLGRINVAGELRTAVRTQQLDVAYQPIVDLATGDVVAMEALARWTNEAGQAVPPDLFIPVAEETGLIAELGALVLRDATRQAAGWQDLGEIGLRVNASAHELRSRTYVDQVTACLGDAGLPAELLGLEITESAFVDDDATTQENLARLKTAAITLLIDDFGTGYSSLSYLQRFPVVDVLKIDRSFLGEGTRGEAVVSAVVGLGRAFGLQVCAEGVETPEQHARVVELGCDFAQGYLWGRPAPSSQVREVIAGWRQ